jgi:hypothetical protein
MKKKKKNFGWLFTMKKNGGKIKCWTFKSKGKKSKRRDTAAAAACSNFDFNEFALAEFEVNVVVFGAVDFVRSSSCCCFQYY